MKLWKQTTVLLLVMGLLLSLCACGGEPDPEVPSTQTTQATQPEASTPPETSGEPSQPEAPTDPETPTDVEDPTEDTTPPQPQEEVRTIALQKQRYGLYEWDDVELLVRSEYSHVTLWPEDAARYPLLAQALEQTAAMIRRSMETEFDDLCASPWGRPATMVSTLDIQVRRADSVVVSLLSDSFADHGLIQDFRGMHGTTYDAQTGQTLQLSDVILDMAPIPALVARELDSHRWAGDLSYDGVVADYFRDTPEDGISWTLDYNGVTFYFADGDLAEPGNGRLTATVAFAEHPELFEARFLSVPEAYMVELPVDNSFFTDLDGDGKPEELNITGWYDGQMGVYTEYGIYADVDGRFHYEEHHCSGLQPYYAKTAQGDHYLYLFCQQGDGPVPQMDLVVYDISGGGLAHLGDRRMGPAYIPTGIIRVPVDPQSLWLDDYDSLAPDAMEHAIGTDGLPVLQGESPILFDPELMEYTSATKDALGSTRWEGYATVEAEAGETFRLPYTDPDGTTLTVSMELAADGTGRLSISGSDEPITWDCDSSWSLWIVREDGQRADMSPYTMPEDGGLWILADLDGYLFWLYRCDTEA